MDEKAPRNQGPFPIFIFKTYTMPSGGYVFNKGGKRLFFIEAERRAFIEAADDEAGKARTFCSLLHYTGCKLTEALTLTPRQIDCASSAIVLIPRLRDVPRAIPVPDSLIELLDKTHGVRRAQSGLRADERIWPYHANTMTKLVIRVIAAAEISGWPQATPTGIRYGYLVQAIRERILLTRIHAWMGHTLNRLYGETCRRSGPSCPGAAPRG